MGPAAVAECLDNFEELYDALNQLLDRGDKALKGKALLTLLLSAKQDFNTINNLHLDKFIARFDKLSSEKNKVIKNVLKEFGLFFKDNVDDYLKFINQSLEQVILSAGSPAEDDD